MNPVTYVKTNVSQEQVLRSLSSGTALLVYLIVLVYLIQHHLFPEHISPFVDDSWRSLFAIHPDTVFTPVTWVGSVLTHYDITHLLVNMVLLIPLAWMVETTASKKQLFAIFFVTGSLSMILQTVILVESFERVAYSFGSSGSILGLMGYLSVTLHKFNIERIHGFTIRLNYLFILSFFIMVGLSFSGEWVTDGIGHISHTAGYLLGVMYALVVVMLK